ncbi:CocE/NonD family hydrolase C-terminal non-catalytic domain-containing protein [Nonomuraea sp. NPDC050680]|uniref:CocE/NonD family hydrolase C-terminal non-catalytic domain-containing protein n=1 Tax=Nonomuraea sp. NPDC050680 TaxID=3154630 RepID=UPI0033E74A76
MPPCGSSISNTPRLQKFLKIRYIARIGLSQEVRWCAGKPGRRCDIQFHIYRESTGYGPAQLFARRAARSAPPGARAAGRGDPGRRRFAAAGHALLPGRSPPSAALHGRFPGRVEVALWPMAHRFRRGHRIRLQVSSDARPRFGRNPGTGEPLATGTGPRASEHEIFHDHQHLSALWLPLASGAS